MKYLIPESDQVVEFTDDVVKTFHSFQQDCRQAEAGGLLFAEFQLPQIIVKHVSTPNPKDRRSRFRFFPNRLLQRRLVKQKFKQGLHLIGEWHTHPEPIPSPSAMDIDSMHEMLLKSAHELNGFIMVIVGTTMEQSNLWVSKHDQHGFERLARKSE